MIPTHSFVALYFAPKLRVVGLSVSTHVGVSLYMDHVYKDCIIGVEDRKLPADLVLLGMVDFDVIFGMD